MMLVLVLIAAAGAISAFAADALTCANDRQDHMMLQTLKSHSSSDHERSGGDATLASEESVLLKAASSSMDGGKQQDAQSSGLSYFFCPPHSHQTQAYPVPLSSPDSFEPVLASHPPGSDGVEQAIIVIHGAGRENEGYFADMVRLVGWQNKQEHTVVVAPSWGEKHCSAADWAGGASSQVRSDAQAPYWTVERPFPTTGSRSWMFGGGSDQGAHSFEVLDSVVEWVEVNYPRLRRVVVTSFSVGGQYVQRWAALSPEGANGVTRSRGLPLRIIVGSPSTLVYLSEERPDPACEPDKDQEPHWNCRNFSIPSPRRNCNSQWNKYWIGLDGLHDGASSEGQLRHDVNQYLRKFIDTSSSSLLSKEIRDRWATKDVRFLFGSRDTVHCDAGAVGACSTLCEAMLTGKSRLQRGLNFMGYLTHLFPGSQPVWGVFHGGHNFLLAFSSRHFTAWALEDDEAGKESEGEDREEEASGEVDGDQKPTALKLEDDGYQNPTSRALEDDEADKETEGEDRDEEASGDEDGDQKSTVRALEDVVVGKESEGEDRDEEASGEADGDHNPGCTPEEGDPWASGALVECCDGLVKTLGLHGMEFETFICKPDSL